MLWDILTSTPTSGSVDEFLSNTIWGLLCANALLGLVWWLT